MGLKFFCDDYDENEFAFLVDPCGKGAFVNMYSLLDDKIFILQSVEESDSDYSFILPRNIATLCPQT